MPTKPKKKKCKYDRRDYIYCTADVNRTKEYCLACLFKSYVDSAKEILTLLDDEHITFKVGRAITNAIEDLRYLDKGFVEVYESIFGKDLIEKGFAVTNEEKKVYIS